MLQKIKETANFIKSKVDNLPNIAIILGTGLGALVEHIKDAQYISYAEIPNFPISTVEGHSGNLIFGTLGNKRVMAMQGRFHYYEGYAMTDVVLPTRLMKMMGAKVLFLTNASGGLNFDYQAGDFMMITDHIMNFVPSPLIGQNIDELGLRFPDMSDIYKKDLQDIIRDTAKSLGIKLQEGVYIQLTGPNFETPAEVKMCRLLGADAAGMSTAAEAVAANHMGMKVCGISCITNLGCGMLDQPLSHEEVQETADRVAIDFKKLVTEVIINIHKAM